MPPLESTRVGRLGAIELHLKKQMEVSSEIAAAVDGLPSPDPWVVLRYNENTDSWHLIGTFAEFPAADRAFVRDVADRGHSPVERMGAGGGGTNRGRVVPPEQAGGSGGGPNQ